MHKSFEILSRSAHAQSKLLCHRKTQFDILSVFLPISSEHKHFFSYLPDYVKCCKIMKNHYEPGLNSPDRFDFVPVNKGTSQIRAAIPYLTDQIRAKISLALIYSGLPLFD